MDLLFGNDLALRLIHASSFRLPNHRQPLCGKRPVVPLVSWQVLKCVNGVQGTATFNAFKIESCPP